MGAEIAMIKTTQTRRGSNIKGHRVPEAPSKRKPLRHSEGGKEDFSAIGEGEGNQS